MRLADIANKQGDTSASLVMERMYSAYRDSMEQYSQHTKILEAEQRMAIQKQRTRYESYLNKYFLVVIVLITVCMGILLLSVNYHSDIVGKSNNNWNGKMSYARNTFDRKNNIQL